MYQLARDCEFGIQIYRFGNGNVYRTEYECNGHHCQ